MQSKSELHLNRIMMEESNTALFDSESFPWIFMGNRNLKGQDKYQFRDPYIWLGCAKEVESDGVLR